jgi:hypothetical protein
MVSRLALIGAAAALCSAAAFAQQAAEPTKKAPPPCEGEIFIFQAGPAGHVAKVTLCSKKDATPDELVRMFESAASTLSQNQRMAPEKRSDLVVQMEAKADEYRGVKSAAAPIPGVTAPATASLAPLRPATPLDRGPEYSALPQLPPPQPTVATPVAAAATPSLLGKPQLRIECFSPAALGGPGPCDSLERETIVKVRADAAVPAGTSLRFLRRGDLRAELELAQLARGKSTQFALPREVCAGVAESKVEIQVVRRAKANDAGQVVESMGPYFLRC